jgi:hypothetical protein
MQDALHNRFSLTGQEHLPVKIAGVFYEYVKKTTMQQSAPKSNAYIPRFLHSVNAQKNI